MGVVSFQQLPPGCRCGSACGGASNVRDSRVAMRRSAPVQPGTETVGARLKGTAGAESRVGRTIRASVGAAVEDFDSGGWRKRLAMVDTEW